jgi:hypothetical protein
MPPEKASGMPTENTANRLKWEGLRDFSADISERVGDFPDLSLERQPRQAGA